MTTNLLNQRKLRTGGPWWFIQLWAQLYFQHQIPNLQNLTKNSFPNKNGKPIRCTSYGQALFSLPGSKLNPTDAVNWFRVFYKGLENPLYFPFTESEAFENPTAFRLDSFADDNSTRHLYSLMIRHGFLPVGMSTSNRIIKPGYETYQPVIAGRQFGLGQVPPHFHINHLVESRADLPNGLTSSRCYSMFDDLHIPILADLSFISSSIGFNTWWDMWKTHVFRRALGPRLQQIDPEYVIPEEEVLNLCIHSFQALYSSLN